MTKKDVLEILHRLPESNKVIVAGGAAAWPELASDIDIWILEGGPSFKECRTILGIPKENLVSKYGLQLPGHITKRAGGWVKTKTGTGMFDVIYIQVQLFKVTFKCPKQLLKQFDLSVHCVGMRQGGSKITIPETTLPGEPINMVNVVNPENTAFRMVKLTKRYEQLGKQVGG